MELAFKNKTCQRINCGSIVLNNEFFSMYFFLQQKEEFYILRKFNQTAQLPFFSAKKWQIEEIVPIWSLSISDHFCCHVF